MGYFFLFIILLMFHFFADFVFQGWFANGKQRSWWIKQCEEHGIDFNKYRYDYLCALVGHSAFWAVVTFLPMLIVTQWPSVWWATGFLAIQVLVHAVIDDLKANKFMINLIQDQTAHIAQIAFAVLVCARFGGL